MVTTFKFSPEVSKKTISELKKELAPILNGLPYDFSSFASIEKLQNYIWRIEISIQSEDQRVQICKLDREHAPLVRKAIEAIRPKIEKTFNIKFFKKEKEFS